MDPREFVLSKVSEEELEELIKKKMDEFSNLITRDAAIYLIAKELGYSERKREEAKVSGRVDAIFKIREFERDGRKGKVCRMIVDTDGRKEVVVLWNDAVVPIEKNEIFRNDVVEVEGSYRENELHSSKPPRLVEKGKTRKIAELEEGNVDVFGIVIEKGNAGTFQKGEVSGKYLSCIISDDTGMIRCVFWNDQVDEAEKLNVGDKVRIENAVLRGGEIHTRKSSRIILIP